MRALKIRKQNEIVTVEVHGQILDEMSFGSFNEAEGYKRSVRRWAKEKGVIVCIRSVRPSAGRFGPVTAHAV
jgi:hypothetical protein